MNPGIKRSIQLGGHVRVCGTHGPSVIIAQDLFMPCLAILMEPGEGAPGWVVLWPGTGYSSKFLITVHSCLPSASCSLRSMDLPKKCNFFSILFPPSRLFLSTLSFLISYQIKIFWKQVTGKVFRRN